MARPLLRPTKTVAKAEKKKTAQVQVQAKHVPAAVPAVASATPGELDFDAEREAALRRLEMMGLED